MAIQRLPEFLINQIKAGEVIERPAALIKELLENALDAHATKITLHLLRAGLDLIHIADDGEGMGQEDLSLAFVRHATSKIKNFEDLYHLQSFGFRGEALASAAAVARITCQSAPAAHPTQGHRIVIAGEQIQARSPIATTHRGTQFWIRDLFYNTPARLKFMRSVASEKTAIKKILTAFLLAYPSVHFTVQWDEEDKKIYPPVAQITERWQQIFTTQQDYLAWHASYEDYAIKGIVAWHASAAKNTYLFCNKRYFQDKALHQIIANQMAPFWHGRGGPYAIFISAIPENIDVNVHPNKLNIKFANPAPLYALLSSSLKEQLAKATTATSPAAPALPAAWGEISLPANLADLETTPAADLNGQGPLPDLAFTKAFRAPASALAVPLLRPPELPGMLCYVFAQASFLIDGRHLLAAYWQQHPAITPLLVVRSWELPPGFNQTAAEQCGRWGLSAEIVQNKIFLRAAPEWIVREGPWPIIEQLFIFMGQHPDPDPTQIWQNFWASEAATALVTEIADAILANLLAQLPAATHRQLALRCFAEGQIVHRPPPPLAAPEISC